METWLRLVRKAVDCFDFRNTLKLEIKIWLMDWTFGAEGESGVRSYSKCFTETMVKVRFPFLRYGKTKEQTGCMRRLGRAQL